MVHDSRGCSIRVSACGEGELKAFFTLAAISVLAQAASKPSGGLPPLIDRELFYGDPEISNAQIVSTQPNGAVLTSELTK